MDWKQEVLKLISGNSGKEIDPRGARSLIKKNLPKSIYKYRAVNDFSLENLRSSTVWMSSPNELNDPFDTLHTLDEDQLLSYMAKNCFQEGCEWDEIDGLVTPESIKEIQNSSKPFDDITNRVLEIEGSIPVEDKPEVLEVPKSAVKRQLDQFKIWSNELLREGLKICSFSEVNDNILMWSHYAKNHEGFCIEWEIRGSENEDELGNLLFPVLYTRNPFDATNHFLAVINGDQPNSLLSTVTSMQKSEDWAYEKEWRLAFALGPDYKSFNRRMPKPSTVFLGEKVSSSDEKIIRDICTHKSVPVRKMKKVHNGYGLEVESI